MSDILEKGDKIPMPELNSSKKQLVYGFKELMDAYKKKDMNVSLASGEKAVINYDDISITNLSGKTRKYSWGELDSIIIREIGSLILKEL